MGIKKAGKGYLVDSGDEAGEGYFMEFEDEETGERITFSVEALFGKLWEDFIRHIVDNVFARGLLREMGLSETEVFHMMERLQMGKAEWDATDYRDQAYI